LVGLDVTTDAATNDMKKDDISALRTKIIVTASDEVTQQVTM